MEKGFELLEELENHYQNKLGVIDEQGRKIQKHQQTIERLQRWLKNKHEELEKTQKLLYARNEDVEYLEKHVAKLQEQNQKLSSQVEKHLEEKNNGNWRREGAVVWDRKHKLKGVLLENPRFNNELHFVCFVPNSGIEDWAFAEYSRGIEPYNGQDKEDVEGVVLENTIEVGEIWQSNEHENRVVVITQIDIISDVSPSTQELNVMNLKTWERAEKGSCQFLRSDYLLENFTKKPLFVLKR